MERLRESKKFRSKNSDSVEQVAVGLPHLFDLFLGLFDRPLGAFFGVSAEVDSGRKVDDPLAALLVDKLAELLEGVGVVRGS